jgi:ABC-type arginine transport system permease subunit
VAGLIYLTLTTLSNLVFMALEQRFSVGVRKPEL